MNTRYRHRWTDCEIDRLYSEYENEKSIKQIAWAHGRTEYAIISKLYREGLLDRMQFNEMFGKIYLEEDDYGFEYVDVDEIKEKVDDVVEEKVDDEDEDDEDDDDVPDEDDEDDDDVPDEDEDDDDVPDEDDDDDEVPDDDDDEVPDDDDDENEDVEDHDEDKEQIEVEYDLYDMVNYYNLLVFIFEYARSILTWFKLI
jgi:hypothetical protein